MKIKCLGRREEIIKRMYWLAYAGSLPERTEHTEEVVWTQVDFSLVGWTGCTIFGRAVNLIVWTHSGPNSDGDVLEIPDVTPRPENQWWFNEYPSYVALLMAACGSLGITMNLAENTIPD